MPELDEPGWTSDDFIRDFPVDFTLVLENVADPDHGIFAHQTPIFDSFAASAEYPMQVSTEAGRAGPKASHPWTLIEPGPRRWQQLVSAELSTRRILFLNPT